jgi:hypothetical protein
MEEDENMDNKLITKDGRILYLNKVHIERNKKFINRKIGTFYPVDSLNN